MNNISYKESFYNFKLTSKENELLMYNSRTGALCSVNKEESPKILSMLENPNKILDEELFKNLVDLGYLIPDELDELQSIREIYDDNRNKNNTLAFVMLPAEACNFSCPYCFTYEQRNMYMEDWVYESVYKCIEKKAIENGDKTTNVGIAWFGGEPLLASDKILEFMNKLNTLKTKYDIEIDAGIVSNGYLLTLDLFKKLRDAGIYSYNITIDGDRDSHNITRKLKTGQDTFDVIYNNFKDISSSMAPDINFNFTIRVNFLKNTVDKMEGLIRQLSSDFSSDKRFNLFFKPIYNIETSRNDIDSISSNICDSDESFENQRKLSYMAMEHNMGDFDNFTSFDPLPNPQFHWCGTVQPFTHIVGADGSIFSCDTLMVDKEHSAGVITKDGDIILNSTGAMWKKSIFEDDNKVIKECLKCKVFPVCMGGCKRSWLLSNSKPCRWTEDKIYDTMENYVKVLKRKKTSSAPQ